jgi:hypothetical protein
LRTARHAEFISASIEAAISGGMAFIQAASQRQMAL